MLCRDVEQNELAVQYLAGELDPELGEDFEVHLLECSRCQAALKTLLLMREDLQARAHEIRSYALRSRSFLQRGWIAIAVVVVLVSVAGFLEIRKVQYMHLSQPAQMPPPQSVHVILTPDQSACGEGCFAHNSSTTEAIDASSKAHAPKHPSSGASKSMNKTDSGKESVAREHSDSHPGAADTSPPDGTSSTDSTAAAQAENTAAPVGNRKPLPRSNLLSEPGERELFRLATINAPPYTFAGFTRYAKDTPSHPGSTGAQPGHLTSPNGKRPAFQNAMLAYVDGDYRRAGDLLERALSQEPPAADAYFYLGICRLLAGDAAGSIAPFKSALDYPKSPLLQSAHYFLAKAYLHTRDYTSAEAELQAAAAQMGEWTRSAKDDLATLQALREREGQ
jgi:TolA-binding protein